MRAHARTHRGRQASRPTCDKKRCRRPRQNTGAAESCYTAASPSNSKPFSLFQCSGVGSLRQTQPPEGGQGPRAGGRRCDPAGEEVTGSIDCMAMSVSLNHIQRRIRFLCSLSSPKENMYSSLNWRNDLNKSITNKNPEKEPKVLSTMNSSYWILVKACNKVLKISAAIFIVFLVCSVWVDVIEQKDANISTCTLRRCKDQYTVYCSENLVMAVTADTARLPPLQQQKRNQLWKPRPAPLIYGTLMMKAVTQAAGPNSTLLPTSPSLCEGWPLRLISSFTQWQSGDMIRQLFAANRAAPQQHKEHFIRTAG